LLRGFLIWVWSPTEAHVRGDATTHRADLGHTQTAGRRVGFDHAIAGSTMSEDALQLGALHRLPDGVEGVLQRRFAHPREAVWPMLVEPEKFAQWLAPGTLEPRPGGAVRIAFHDSGTVIDSVLTAFEPPRLLAYSWSSGAEPARPLRWELAQADGATRLTLRVRVPAGEDAAKACAGFEGHLEMLAAALEGVPIRFPFDTFLAARDGYRRLLGALR
jgi:uncharacterized protein YndB with AHSA1/START domain